MALGVAVATAVITGSLVVGDSVTASVRDVALARLGRISYALAVPAFFREKLAEDVMRAGASSDRSARVVPLTIVAGAARNPASGAVVPNAGILGVGDGFWKFYSGDRRLRGREVALNESLASDLGIGVGEYVLVNVSRPGEAPAETLFAHRDREHVLRSMRLKIVEILPDFGPGGFALGSQTSQPRNAFVSNEWLARQLARQGRANALLVEAEDRHGAGEWLQTALESACTPTDYGLKIVANERGGYLSVESDTLVLTDSNVEAIRQAARECDVRSAVTSVYLADSIRGPSGKSISYAVIAGFEPLDPLPMKDGLASLDGDGILLNAWAAADLGAEIGDALEVAYLVSSRDGVFRTRSKTFSLRGIVELKGPAADPGLVPDFEGITEAESVSDWDPPFPIDLKRVTDRDEEYWTRYRAAPKAFVSPAAARMMWKSAQPEAATPWITSVRLAPPNGVDLATIRKQFEAALKKHLRPEDAGMVFRPALQIALAASKGTQDYGVLFLSMSMFLVAAAMGLAGMLMRLSIRQRAAQAGTLLACGFTNRAAMVPVMGEGAALSLAGAVIGVPLGIAYARGIVFLLTAGRLGSIGDASLWLHVNGTSLAIGGGSGLIAGLVSVWWATRSLGKSKVLELLAGWQAMNVLPGARRKNVAKVLLIALTACAGALLVFFSGTGAFFGSGAALLAAGLCASYLLLVAVRGRSLSLPKLALRSAAANTGRSMLAVGLLASATFVITAVAAHTRDYSRADVTRRDSGAGGFPLRATSSTPVRYDFGTTTGRNKLGFDAQDEEAFAGVKVFSFLSNTGDDISCLNLAKPMAPRVLGVGREMIERGGFRLITQEEANKPWELLEQPSDDGTIPVIGDADSIRWQLHSGLGKLITIRGADGKPVDLKVVGMIAGSVFAGELLISEENFRRIFPAEDVPRYFLIETPPEMDKQAGAALRRNLGDVGLEVRSTREILNTIIGVQNSYIATFVALGGLGVVLGTFGLVIVLLRGALERRGEFALMLATGFRRNFLAAMLMIENGGLLCAGLLCGAVCALVAVAPQIGSVESDVNWGFLTGLLAVIVGIGLASCALAARAVVRGNLIEALREE